MSVAPLSPPTTATRPPPKFRTPGCSSALEPTTTRSRTSLKSSAESSTAPRPDRPRAVAPRGTVAAAPPAGGAPAAAGSDGLVALLAGLGAPDVAPGAEPDADGTLPDGPPPAAGTAGPLSFGATVGWTDVDEASAVVWGG